MTWLFYALLAPAVYTIVMFIDKHVVSNAVKDSRGIVINAALVGLIVGTLFWFIFGRPVLSVTDAGLILLSGFLVEISSALYFRVMAVEDASMVIILFQTTPVFVLILSLLFLNESASFVQIIGFLLILAAAIGLSVEKGKKQFKLTKSFWLMIVINILYAISAILVKFAIGATSFQAVLSYESWGMALGGVFLFALVPDIRNPFLESFKILPTKVLSIMFCNEVLFVLAKAINFYAYVGGPAFLVSVLGGTQVFYGILLGWLLTIFLPKLYRENIQKQALLEKAAWAIMIFAGVYLIGG